MANNGTTTRTFIREILGAVGLIVAVPVVGYMAIVMPGILPRPKEPIGIEYLVETGNPRETVCEALRSSIGGDGVWQRSDIEKLLAHYELSNVEVEEGKELYLQPHDTGLSVVKAETGLGDGGILPETEVAVTPVGTFEYGQVDEFILAYRSSEIPN